MPTSSKPRLAFFAIVALMVACHSDETISPVNTGGDAFWALRFDHEAVTLALTPPYDTVRLVATPTSPSGDAIDLPQPAFSSTNVNSVTVDADGRVTAVGLTPGAQVIATLTADGVTHADTATVAVTPDASLPVASFSIQPVAPDSARFALGGSLLEPFHNITPTVLDPNGAPIVGLPVHYQSLDATTGSVDPWSGTVTGFRLGYFPVVATMLAYGRLFTDTLQFRIQRPAYAKVLIHGPMYAYVPYEVGSFDPDSITVGTGAVVEWEDAGRLPGTASDITFDAAQAPALDSVPEQFSCVNYQTDCGGTGNVAAFGPPTNDPTGLEFWLNYGRARRFTQPGVYRYTNTISNTHAVVVVLDETAP